jgi:hypothetical protein
MNDSHIAFVKRALIACFLSLLLPPVISFLTLAFVWTSPPSTNTPPLLRQVVYRVSICIGSGWILYASIFLLVSISLTCQPRCKIDCKTPDDCTPSCWEECPTAKSLLSILSSVVYGVGACILLAASLGIRRVMRQEREHHQQVMQQRS